MKGVPSWPVETDKQGFCPNQAMSLRGPGGLRLPILALCPVGAGGVVSLPLVTGWQAFGNDPGRDLTARDGWPGAGV